MLGVTLSTSEELKELHTSVCACAQEDGTVCAKGETYFYNLGQRRLSLAVHFISVSSTPSR